MSAQPFEIRCPACGSVVAPDAPGCQNCSKTRIEAANAAAPAASVPLPVALTAPTAMPADLATMRLKDYHRLVRTNYRAVEGPRVAGRPRSGLRFQAYLPFVLLLLGLLVGVAVAFGRL